MRKYVVIPDSFKGCLSSGEICGIIAREIRRWDPEARVCALPVADGGEGTVDAFLGALGGEKVAVPCRDPYGRPLTAHYGLFPDGKPPSSRWPPPRACPWWGRTAGWPTPPPTA